MKYLNRRRSLYLIATINQIPIKRALVDIGASANLIPMSTLEAAKISESKIQGFPIEVTEFDKRGECTVGYMQL